MNTKTIEQKARAYDEALERARKLYNDAKANEYKSDMEDYEYIFPELAESEDERIRKRLIEYFEGFSMGNAEVKWEGLNVQEVLVWLEKQKEQKSLKVGENAYFDPNTQMWFIKKEQKPADNPKWAELTWKDINELERIINNVHYEFQNGIGEDSFGELVLERFREYKDDGSMDEQKPAEWSEEDEKLFWGLTAYVPNEELERLGVTRNDILKKLKSIRHHPIQIKEAYKEGFQTARHATALAFMNYCDKIRPNGKMCLSNGECEEIEKAFLVGDWDKIERYFHKCHWKPSEEQMKALNEIVNILAASPFLHQNDYLFNILNGLREELKKLL